MILAALALLQAAVPVTGSEALQALRQMGMSAAGVDVIRRMAQPSLDDNAFQQRRFAIRDRLRAVSAAQPFDVEGFGGLLKAEAQARGEAQVRIAEKTAATLRALPPEDRPIFARIIVQQTFRGAAPAAAPAAPRKPGAGATPPR